METGGATIKLVMTQMPVRIYLATRPLIDMAALILTAILTLTLLQIGVQFRVPVTAKQMAYRLTQHNGVTKMEMDMVKTQRATPQMSVLMNQAPLLSIGLVV